MVPLKPLITVACTIALIATAALTEPLVAHSDEVTFGPDASPAEVAARIAAGDGTSLVIMPDGEICSWGSQFTDRYAGTSTPSCFRLPGDVAATSISAKSHAVAVGADRRAYTWGAPCRVRWHMTTPTRPAMFLVR
jgi:alpha-tubulin suppressor-like RCC1 family protein